MTPRGVHGKNKNHRCPRRVVVHRGVRIAQLHTATVTLNLATQASCPSSTATDQRSWNGTAPSLVQYAGVDALAPLDHVLQLQGWKGGQELSNCGNFLAAIRGLPCSRGDSPVPMCDGARPWRGRSIER